MNRKIKILFIIVVLLFAGFIRENFFKNLNTWISFKSGNSVQIELPTIWNFISEMSVESLASLKWIATLLFTGIFYGLSLLLVKILFPKANNFFFVTITFIGIIILAGISILLGKLIPEIYSSTYYFSRWLMGAAQSPLLPSILCILIYYSNLSASKRTLSDRE